MNGITIIVIALGAWGRGDTYDSALGKCIDAGGRQHAGSMHVVYACTDPDCTVNDRGCIEYRHDAALKKVMVLRQGRAVRQR